MVDAGTNDIRSYTWKCFVCRTWVFASGSRGDCVKTGPGQFMCKKCKEQINVRNREQRAERQKLDTEHWDAIGDLPLEA